ncbi:MAG: PEP-CTERM sorting domain-containing protein [Phycisphaerae bacterium]|nr:PEP-CTERM sorting domain-containing protein [Phycisphaerae bacterium]
MRTITVRILVVAAAMSALAGTANRTLGANIAVLTGLRVYHDDFTSSGAMAQAYNLLLLDGHSFTTVTEITQASLAGNDVVFIPALRPDMSGLASSEVAAISAHVNSGGGLVFIGEHGNNTPSFPDGWLTVDNTVLNPLGFNQSAFDTPEGWQSYNLTNTQHPIAQGPYGTVTSATFGHFGLVERQPGMSSLLDYGPGSAFFTVDIGLGRGVFLMDSDVIEYSGLADPQNRVLLRNTFAYVPEPATFLLLALGGLAILRRR